MRINPVNLITIRCYGPSIKVVALLGDGVATVEEGYGGWEQQPRARRKALTLWNGILPIKMKLPILIDHDALNVDVDTAVANLERMTQPAGTNIAPGNVRIFGAAPHTDIVWKLSNITWDDTQRQMTGRMRRWQGTLELLEFVPEDTVHKSPTADARGKAAAANAVAATVGRTFDRTTYGYSPSSAASSGANTVYTAKNGDTLGSIASSKLGDYRRWSQIADMNNIQNPFKVFHGGEKLRLPAA
jgi:LysM repeat protein